MRKQSFFRRVLAVPLGIFALGLLGLAVFGAIVPEIILGRIDASQFLRDLAMTTIIIGALGLLVEVSEFSGYFEERLLDVVVHEDYLKNLDEEALKRHSISGIREFASRVAKNKDYRAHGVIEQVYADVLPLIGKVYRESYTETIESIEVSSSEVEGSVKLSAGTISGTNSITRSKTQTSFWFISPFHDQEIEENYRWLSIVQRIPGLPIDKYVKLRVRLDGSVWEDAVVSSVLETDDVVHFQALIPIRIRGKTRIELENEEYDNGPIRYRTMKMTYLTRGMDLTVVSKTPMEFDGEIYGLLTGETPEPQKTSISVGLRYDGWLLPNDGYVVYAEPKEAARNDS